MAEYDGQIKLKFLMYRPFFNINTRNAIKLFDAGVESEKLRNIKLIFFGLNL